MLTSTTKTTTWAAVNAPARKSTLRVRPYVVARPGGVFLAAELALLGMVLLPALLSAGKHPSFEVALAVALCVVFFHARNLDRSVAGTDAVVFFRDLCQALAFALGTEVVLFELFPALESRNGGALTGILLAGLLAVALRPVLKTLIRRRKFVEGILVVGTGNLAESLCLALAGTGGVAQEKRSNSLLHFPAKYDSEYAVDLARFQEMVSSHGVSRVVIAEADEQSRRRLAAVLVDSRLRGLRVTDGTDFYEQCFGKICVDEVDPEWFLYSEGFNASRFTSFVKRVFDLVFAALLLVLCAPLFVIVAIAIKLDSMGPALFRQVRVGRHGSTFEIFKFRSMRVDAEAGIGPAWATEFDPRVTRLGRLLRKFRVDELPQLINVLRGEMSLVGPRPERPYFVDRLAEELPFYNLRHYVQPGITGWAQVMYQYGASIEDAHQKLQYDIHYVKHQSLVCDLKILCKTVGIVLRGRGR